jgi:predicted dehydrogenase
MQTPVPPSTSTHGFTRRDFLRTTALVLGAAATTGPALLRGQNLNSKLNIAGIGAGGKGDSDIRHCESENIVACCDTDESQAKGVRQRNPNAKYFRDFRKMFDEMGSGIDAVTVSTPDHTHAVAATLAMSLGKHVYCQKPLTQNVYEARYLRDLAKQKKLVTQMGNQGSAEDGLRRAVECIQAGLIGPVRQLYVWSNRPVWPSAMPMPGTPDPVPASLDWDQWIGPAPMRPYKNGVYSTFNWRGWTDFGTGALGDMACHTANMPFRALKLGYPTLIEAESSEFNGVSYPLASHIRFEFPQREGLVPVTFHWYDGGKPKPNDPYRHDGSNKPPKDITADVEAMRGEVPGSGCLLIGDKGKIFSPDDYGSQFFLKLSDEKEFTPARNHAAVTAIPQTIPRNKEQGDSDKRQHLEWLAAIKQNKPDLCYANFDIAAYLTEIILLGCVALRVGKRLDWDGPNMVAKNAPEAAKFVRPPMRAGWKLA